MIKETQYIEIKSSSSGSEGGDEPGTGHDIQMIKTPDNNCADLHHDLDSIIKAESEMTALIDNSGGDVTDGKSGGGNASNHASPGSSNNDQKQQLMSNDMCLGGQSIF